MVNKKLMNEEMSELEIIHSLQTADKNGDSYAFKFKNEEKGIILNLRKTQVDFYYYTVVYPKKHILIAINCSDFLNALCQLKNVVGNLDFFLKLATTK